MSLVSSYTTRNKLLLPATAIILLLSWFLAFKKTFHAIALNHQLQKASVGNQDLSYNPEYINRRLIQLDHILQRFEADSSAWKDQFWLKVSSVADTKGIGVIYRPSDVAGAEEDIASVLRASIQFRGKFKELVMLLDSLEKTAGIGKVSSAAFEKEKPAGQRKEAVEIILKTDFKSIRK